MYEFNKINKLLILLSSVLITLSLSLYCIVSRQQFTVVSSAYIINWKSLLAFGKSLIYILNKRGPRIDPCGMLCCMSSIFNKKIQSVHIVSGYDR